MKNNNEVFMEAFIRQQNRRIEFFKNEIIKRTEQNKQEIKELKSKLAEAKKELKLFK